MENMDIYELAIKHTIDTARGDYLDIIDNKRELAITCIESVHKMRMFLDRHPKFFEIIEREKEKQGVDTIKEYSSLYGLFKKQNKLNLLFKSKED